MGEAVVVGSGELRYRARPGWEQLPEGVQFVDVAGMATDSQGQLYVFNRGGRPVLRFDRDGRCLGSWGEGRFTRPHGLHIGPDDTLYCVDDQDHTVRRFTPDGELLLQIGKSGCASDTGATSSDFRTIQRAPDGDLFISDGYGNARIHRFSAEGEWRLSWGEPGSGPGQFRVPHGIAVDSDGVVWVADRENSRLQRFSPDGTFLGEWTDIARPCEVFIDSRGLVYVAELGYHVGMWPGTTAPSPDAPRGRLSIFDRDGTLLSRWGNHPDPLAPESFFAPHDVWVDREGVVYVGEVVASAGRGTAPEGTPTLRTFVPM
jgi:hypothetical protein